MDGILISEPIRSFDSIVHVPSPIILMHVTQRSIYSTLCSYRMTSSGEELGYTRRVEPSLGETKCCSQTRSTGTNNDSIIFMILPDLSIMRPIPLLCIHTTTGYLLLTKGEASFARRGACVMIRAGSRG